MSDASSVSELVGSAVPTTLPRRMTVIRSATARTSRSLWVMKTIEVPDSLSWRMIAMSSSVSCGVSTAVGSSRMRTSAWRESALMISTRCWTPTGRSSTSASGSTWKPNWSEISVTRRRASGRSIRPPPRTGSWPSTTFSATVKTGTSMKCWWTMPMPGAHGVARAGEGDRDVVDEDLAVVGVVEPVQHVHERALAGTVLAEQRVDLTGLDRPGRCGRWRPGTRSAW